MTITTRFSRSAAEWYDKWLAEEMYHIEPPEIEVTRIPIIGMKHQSVPEDLVLDDVLVLEHDSENKFDPKAIKVLYQDVQIGWIPRKQTYCFHGVSFNQEGEDLSVLPKVISGKELFVYVVTKYG